MKESIKESINDLSIHYRNITSSIPLDKVCLLNLAKSLLRSVIGPENWHHSLNQSDAKLKLITTWPLAFPRALEILVAFTLSSSIFLSSD